MRGAHLIASQLHSPVHGSQPPWPLPGTETLHLHRSAMSSFYTLPSSTRCDFLPRVCPALLVPPALLPVHPSPLVHSVNPHLPFIRSFPAGKCANRLLASSGAPEVARQMRVSGCWWWGDWSGRNALYEVTPGMLKAGVHELVPPVVHHGF